MPRKIFTITSKEDPNKKIELNSLSYELALEEALYNLDPKKFEQHQESIDEHALSIYCSYLEEQLEKLGWTISEDWDEPYKSMLYDDEHMMSLWNQRSEYGKQLIDPPIRDVS
jgi:hypothetical protein